MAMAMAATKKVPVPSKILSCQLIQIMTKATKAGKQTKATKAKKQTRATKAKKQNDYQGQHANWRQYFIGAPWRQDKYDDRCIYHALAELIQAMYLKDHNEQINISRDTFHKEATEGKPQSDIYKTQTALIYASTEGLLTYKDHPRNTIHGRRIKIQRYQVLHGRNMILQNLNSQPLLGEYDVHDEMVDYKGGILKFEDIKEADQKKKRTTFDCKICGKTKKKPFWCATCGIDGKESHQVVLTGYDATLENEHYLEFLNSSGDGWGEDGYGRVHLPATRDISMKTQGILNIESKAWIVEV